MTPSNSIKYPFLVGGPPGLGIGRFPNYATRAAAEAAGAFVPAYNESLPIKGWADPSGSGGTYLYFDPTATATGYISTMLMSAAQASVYNLPGIASFPAPVYQSCIVTQNGFSGDISNEVCNESDAQAMVSTLQNYSPALYPGKTMTLQQDLGGMFPLVYASGETRRKWMILVNGQSIGYAQEFIEAANRFGVGAPITWVLNGLVPNAVAVPQVQTAPPGAVVLPMPIRALLPDESIQPQETKPPGNIQWFVVNTSAQLAQAQAAYDAAKAALAEATSELVAAGGNPT